MSQFSSNLPPPPRSRFSCGPCTVFGRHPLISSSSVIVPALAAIMTPPSDGVGSLALVLGHGHSVIEDVVPLWSLSSAH